MIHFSKALLFFALFTSINASAEEVAEEIDLTDGISDNYSPYSYKANCSYQFDAGCSGSVYNPASGSTVYVGNRPVSNSYGYSYKNSNAHEFGNRGNFLRKRNSAKRAEFSRGGGWRHGKNR